MHATIKTDAGPAPKAHDQIPHLLLRTAELIAGLIPCRMNQAKTKRRNLVLEMGKSLLYGMATALDLGGVLAADPDEGLTPAQRDWQAIASDWAVVGQDIRAAMDELVAQG